MLRISENAKAVTDEDGTTILDVSANRIFALNETGSLIWAGLEANRSLEDIVNTLLASSSVSRDIAARDVNSFIEDLSSRDLLEHV